MIVYIGWFRTVGYRVIMGTRLVCQPGTVHCAHFTLHCARSTVHCALAPLFVGGVITMKPLPGIAKTTIAVMEGRDIWTPDIGETKNMGWLELTLC